MSFLCECLGLLESLRHLIVDLSREKHTKVLILFVTTKLALFVYLQSSLLTFCKTKCMLFPYCHLQQRPWEWKTHFRFATLDYHSFFSFRSHLLRSTSQLPSYCLWAKRLNTFTSKNTRWPNVQRLSALISRRAFLLLFASHGRSLLFTSWRIGSFLTSTHTLSNSSEVVSLTSFFLNVMKLPFLQDRACVISNDAP